MHSPEMPWKDNPPTRGRPVHMYATCGVRLEAVRGHDDGIKGVLGQGERPKSTDVLTMLPSGSMCVFWCDENGPARVKLVGVLVTVGHQLVHV